MPTIPAGREGALLEEEREDYLEEKREDYLEEEREQYLEEEGEHYLGFFSLPERTWETLCTKQNNIHWER